MSLTQHGFCPTCDDRRELVMTSPGVLACHSCGNVDVYENRDDYEKVQNDE
ncbi:hypothetical protein [Natronomonas gomsonensis]|uniref:hypothetical protein n=1 Tax=Natronomonas gomsonensis TaxID=1046043 RepID=UPI0015C07079|nr:hypothetical protein [Natronomonas gomsonensis]